MAGIWIKACVEGAFAADSNRCLCAARNYVQMSEVGGTDTEGDDPWMPVPPAHSYSDCRNRMSASEAWNFPILVSGGSSLASAFCFMARLASM